MNSVQRRSVLGDLRAEADALMLDKAFYVTPDCRDLIESEAKSIVIGRRGTGKSALAYYLEKHFKKIERTVVLNFSFEESSVIGIGKKLDLFKDNYRLVSAACKLAFRYAIMLEIACKVSSENWKFKEIEDIGVLREAINDWILLGTHPEHRLYKFFASIFSTPITPEDKIAQLSMDLKLSDIERCLLATFEKLKLSCVLLVDRLDEGYEPDNTGTGLVAGLAEAIIHIKTRLECVRSIVFVRDNMFRKMSQLNPDYSRNIEGSVLRIHWDEYMLQNMVTNRFRAAFNASEEATLKVWNAFVSSSLKGNDGFRRCLRLTLYRPRDLLVLLNEAFANARKHDRSIIDIEDLNKAGRDISNSRMDDLIKEYKPSFPGLNRFVKCFTGLSSEISAQQAMEMLEAETPHSASDPLIDREMAIEYSPEEIIRSLYSMGFIGIKDGTIKQYVFCHDGNTSDRTIHPDDSLLVHPCFWLSLNMPEELFGSDLTQEIHDEYEITVSNVPAKIRQDRMGALMSDLGRIQQDNDSVLEFAEWVAKAIRVVFAGHLYDVHSCACSYEEMCGISAINLCRGDSWQYLQQHFHAHRIYWVVGNIPRFTEDWICNLVKFAQSTGEKVIFAVIRDDSLEEKRDGDLLLVKNAYKNANVAIVKITAAYLHGLIGKLRNPQKHDAVEKSFFGVIRTTCMNYLSISKAMTIDHTPSSTNILIEKPSQQCFAVLCFSQKGTAVLKFYENTNIDNPIHEYTFSNHKYFDIIWGGIETARNQKRSHKTKKSIASSMDTEPIHVSWNKQELFNYLYHRPMDDDNSKHQKAEFYNLIKQFQSIVSFSDTPFFAYEDKSDKNIIHSSIPLCFSSECGTSYNTTVSVEVDGRRKNGKSLVRLNNNECWLSEKSFEASLMLALAARKTPLGWVKSHDIDQDHCHQTIQRLRKDFQDSSIKADLIENDRSKSYRFSTPPHRISLNEEMIILHSPECKRFFDKYSVDPRLNE